MAIILFGSVIAYAASWDVVWDGTPSTEATTQVENPLLLDSIEAIDDMHIVVRFNQNIIPESVRVRIAKQSDESNIRIEKFGTGADALSIIVTLTDALVANTAYKMTIISAISESGIIIKDGADGLKEFTTPTDLVQYVLPELNAPSNPNAVMVTPVESTGSEVATSMQPIETVTDSDMSPSETAEELPLTGVDSTLFLVIAAVLGWLLLFRRRQA